MDIAGRGSGGRPLRPVRRSRPIRSDPAPSVPGQKCGAGVPARVAQRITGEDAGFTMADCHEMLTSAGHGGGSLGAAKPDRDNVPLRRLQGIAALQVNNGYCSSDRDLEGVHPSTLPPVLPGFSTVSCRATR